MIQLQCNGCGKTLRVADKHLGQRARCPVCSEVNQVPEHSTDAAVLATVESKVTEPAMSVATLNPSVSPSVDSSVPAYRPAPLTHAAPIQNRSTASTAPLVPTGGQQPAPAQHVTHHYHRMPAEKDPSIAALLEVLFGAFMQTFGIGHIYAGNVGIGLLFMFGYWLIAFINLFLIFILIGLVTYPICWIAVMIISPIVAANMTKRR